MSKRDIRVPVRYYLRLANVLLRFKVDIAAEMQARKLPVNVITNPDATLKFSQVEGLIGHLNRKTGRTDLGYELGKELNVSTHSIVGFGMLSSPTVEQALQFVGRYFQLVMPTFRLRFKSGADAAELHFTPVVAMGHECLAFHLEAIGMAALRDVRDLNGGRAPPCRLSLSISRPAHARRYSEVRGLEVEFGAEQVPGVRLLFEGGLRELPLTLADPNALKVAETRCRAQVAHVARVGQFAEWVAMSFREVSEGLPSLPDLAATLNISPRTLNRYLEREGTSFRELAGRIQHEIARERLSAGEMSITEVAYSLGFGDPANFTRSFRDREGVSPREFSLKQQRARRT
ncbi:MAG: AraC family transcriptional regulator ligand-binding domain-containing protein [Nevskia sp.]|nr:AraC family transcriptional regulator ligand-binding domain-containing protein [Nevskia sp.]